MKNIELTQDTIIFSDSKGLSLKDVLSNRLEQNITVIAKSGANIYNESHYYKLN